MNRAVARLMKLIPNMLTLLRVVLACLLNFYILYHFGSLPIPIIIFLLIFITDFLDGKIARLYGNTSHFGAIFDILADLFYIVAFYIVLCSFHVLPLWFFFIALFKFIEFVATSFFIKKLCSENSIFVFDFIGRCAAVFFYIVPILAYASFQLSQVLYFFIIHILIYFITFMVFVSSSYRLRNCAKIKYLING
jgi:phosphatidylglycerophosphate synthase